MTTIQPPAWLNLDAVISPELRDEIPALTQSARQFVEHLAEFLRTTVPAWRAMTDQICDAMSNTTVDNLEAYVEEMVGLDEIDDMVCLSEWALSTILQSIVPNEIAQTIIAKRLTGATAEVFGEFYEVEHERQNRAGVRFAEFVAERDAE
ncbi:MAG: hypothetical protein ABIQ73_08840 [Acidimicrobiales bacterium]